MTSSLLEHIVTELGILSQGGDKDINSGARIRFAILLGLARTAGVSFSVVSTVRSISAQRELHDLFIQGSITNEPAATSWHLVGHDGSRAMDVIFDGNVYGRTQKIMGNIAGLFGLRWGGDFSTPDPAHFDFPGPRRPDPVF